MPLTRRPVVLVLATLALAIASVPDTQAQPARGSVSSKPGASSKPAARRTSFTPAMWTAARSLYQKNLSRLTQTRGSAQAPKPRLNATPAGNQPMALPSNQPAGIRTGRGWSMTATRGERNSIVSSRTYSSGSLSNTSTSVSSNASGNR